MFSKLQEDAMQIDIGIKNLLNNIPFVINKYTYHNKNPEEIIQSKTSALSQIECDIRKFLEDQQTFDTLLEGSLNDIADISTALETIQRKFQIEVKLSKLETSPELNRGFESPCSSSNENKENSTDTSSSPLVLISRQRQDTDAVAETPAIKSDRKPRVPLRNRIEFLKENFN